MVFSLINTIFFHPKMEPDLFACISSRFTTVIQVKKFVK